MNDIQTELTRLREKGWTLVTIAESLGVPYGTVKKWSAGMRYPANAQLVKAALKRLLEGKPSRRARPNPQPDIASLSFEEWLALAYKYMGAFRHLATGRSIVDELSEERIREAKQERREAEEVVAVAKSPIPEFKSYEEEAEFWDTHDTTDFEDEFKSVEVRFAKNFVHSLQIPFRPKDFLALSHAAEAKGTDIISLAKSWILSQLKEEGGLAFLPSCPGMFIQRPRRGPADL